MASNITPTPAEFRGAWRSAFRETALPKDHAALEKVLRYAAFAAGLSYDDEVAPKLRRLKPAPTESTRARRPPVSFGA